MTKIPFLNTAALKREALREQVWPGSSTEVWNRKTEKGFTTIPRTLGLIMTLIEELVERKKGHDVSRVYFELWCRSFDEGFIDNLDEEASASPLGSPLSVVSILARTHRYTRRAWFRSNRTEGNKAQGYVLLEDPHKVIKALQAQNRIRRNGGEHISSGVAKLV